MARGSKPGERRGGRKAGVPNKATREIKGIAEKYGEESIRELVRISKTSESDSTRVLAIKELLDRGYGKARQSLEHTGPNEGPIEIEAKPITNFEIAKLLLLKLTSPDP